MDSEFNSSNDQLEQKDDKKKKGCLKKFAKFLFSHVGLVIIVAIYAVAGAFLFQLLEQHQEAKDCQEGKGQESANIVNLKSTLLTYIQFNISTSSTDSSKDNETVANDKIETWLKDYRDQVLDVRSTYRYFGQDCSTFTKWTIPGSLLFAMTVFTTIGYGHIAPVTWEGQIVCICYATIGIPLFLMCLSNISGVLGDMFRFVYGKICCRLCNKKKKPNKNEDEVKPEGDTGAQQFDDNLDGTKVVDDNEDLNNEEEDEKVTVPLTITMIILTIYIFLGAFLFNLFEKWTLVEGGYFSFITLATIGFGDFVPGQNDKDPNSGYKLMAGSFYLILGMAILAMCFDLMQEEIIAKFTWIGMKMGLIEKEPDEEGENEKETKDKPNEENKKEKPAYVAERTHYKGDSPVPGYSSMDDERENMSRLRSAYFQNVVQRKL